MENTPEMTNFTMTPEMRAFRHHEKNKDYCLEQGVREGFDNMWREVASEAHSLMTLTSKPAWEDKEYREAYMEASIEQAISWQVKINRQKRGLTKQQLADKVGVKVRVIERLEDPEINDHSLELLVKVAKAFDCALSIKLLSYEQLAQESLDLSEQAQYVPPFRTILSQTTHLPEQT